MSKIHKLIDEFIVMKPGEMIENPTGIIHLGNTAQFTRRSLKHFIESRTRSGNTREEINYLIKKAPEVIGNPQLNIPNPNKTYPGSSLLGRLYNDTNKAVIIILDKGEKVRDIISLHFKNRIDFQTLMTLLEKK